MPTEEALLQFILGTLPVKSNDILLLSLVVKLQDKEWINHNKQLILSLTHALTHSPRLYCMNSPLKEVSLAVSSFTAKLRTCQNDRQQHANNNIK